MDMIRKLRVRFVSIMMVIVCTMLIIIFGLVVHRTHSRIREDGLRMMENAAYAPMGTLSDRNPKRKDENKTMNILLPFFRVLIDADGKIVDMDGDYYDLTQEGLEAVLEELVSAVTASEEKVGDLRDYNLRYYRSGARKWDGQIIIFMDISSEIATMQNLYRTCVIIGLGSFASFLVISIFFARWAVRPVEEAWAQQRQFVSDASHELKTPLTVILTDAEMLKSPRFDEAHKAQFVENILTMSNQMRGLVESLLQLARVDSGAIQKMPLQTIDLSGLVSDELLTFDALFFEKGLTLAENIVKNHKGRIWAESAEGINTFRVELPMA